MGSLTTSDDSSSAITTTTTTNTTTTTTTTSKPHQLPFQLLEITVISAQDLPPVAKSMRTYAVVWIHPDRKKTTRTDNQGNANPTWNDKFVFRVDDDLLSSDTSAVMIEIYTVSWLRDNLVGSVRVLISNLIPPSSRPRNDFGTRFVALQVRRVSGSPQGILNMGVSLLDSTMRSMPLCSELGASANGGNRDLTEKKLAVAAAEEEEGDLEKQRLEAKIQLWRSRSERTDLTTSEDYNFPPKGGSMCNGSSTVNGGSEVCSDVGPSASIVAAAIAKGLYPPPPPPTGKKLILAADVDDGASSILEDLTMEEAMAKGYKWKAERLRAQSSTTAKGHNNSEKAVVDGRHARRLSDGSLFSCFVYGLEFTIVCGANTNPKNNKNSTAGGVKPIKRSHSHQNLTF